MKIVVTGAQGQLGGELCRQIGNDAVGMDLPDFDLLKPDQICETLKQHQPDLVINTAAYTQVDKAEEEEYICHAVNGTAVKHLADACRKITAVLVQISTDYVFGGRDRSTPYVETDKPDPLSVYAQTKLEGEQYASQCERHFIVRTCGLYGRPGENTAGNFVETMLHLGRERNHLRIIDDQQCTPSYIVHVARAIRFLAGTSAYGTYNVVNSGVTTWYDFAAEIFRLSGLTPELERITTGEYGALAPRPRYSVLDTTKYHALPGRPALAEWNVALREYLDKR